MAYVVLEFAYINTIKHPRIPNKNKNSIQRGKYFKWNKRFFTTFSWRPISFDSDPLPIFGHPISTFEYDPPQNLLISRDFILVVRNLVLTVNAKTQQIKKCKQSGPFELELLKQRIEYVISSLLLPLIWFWFWWFYLPINVWDIYIKNKFSFAGIATK